MQINWYKNIRTADMYTGYRVHPAYRHEDAQSITQMIKGLAHSRGIGEGAQERIINESINRLQEGYDVESVRQWAKSEMTRIS